MADDSQDERYYKKGYAIRKLSHENHRTWFAEIDLKFNAKGVKWAVDASVATPGPPILTPAQSLSSSAAPEEPWNNAYTKNSTAYPKADAEARLIILKYLNEEDKEIMVMVPSSGEMLAQLHLKYSRELESTNRDLLAVYTNYVKPADKSIDSAWAKIFDVSRRLLTYHPSLTALTTERYRLGILMRGLPSEYQVTIDTIDAQDNPNIQDTLRKLRSKELSLATETAAAARLGKQKA
ncbi:MAG: hypothetical protein Q9203_007754, partial [Teloschistes exilis]